MSLFNKKVFEATNLTVQKRGRLFRDKDLDSLKEEACAKRQKSLEQADKLWKRAAEGFESRGIHVHFAAHGPEARQLIHSKIGDGTLVVKGKSLTTEEIELRQFLEGKGLEVVETDLGEWIIQQRGELPSHLIVPAIHLSAGQVAAMIEEKFGEKTGLDAAGITKFARRHLRKKFLAADAGIVGSNFVVADPPTIGIVSNEGNVSLAARLPSIVFVVVGYDRIYDSTCGLQNVQQLLTASATGQEDTSYLDFLRAPLPHQQVHLVVLDNGRKALMDSDLKEAARCIRCAACLNVCPVYQEIGGHAFGKIYHGGIGSILTAFTSTSRDAAAIATYCMRCSTCETHCPMQVPVAKLVSLASKDFGVPAYLRIALGLLRVHEEVDVQKSEKPGAKTAVFLGCAFRSRLLGKEQRAIVRAAARFCENATLIHSGCCGMPHFNKGLLAESDKRLDRLAATFEGFDEVLVPCSSGYAFMRQRLGNKIKLMSANLFEKAGARLEATGKIYYHLPCHLKGAQEIDEKNIISQNVDIEDWENSERCCGSAGTYVLQHPFISKKILSRKKGIEERRARIVTSCPSCIMQLRRAFGSGRVLHPLRLLMESLP